MEMYEAGIDHKNHGAGGERTGESVKKGCVSAAVVIEPKWYLSRKVLDKYHFVIILL